VLPEIEVSLPVGEKIGVPVAVEDIKPDADIFKTNPEDSLILGEVVIPEDLLHLRSPRAVSMSPFAFPASVAPGITHEEESVGSMLHYFKDSIRVVANKSNVLFINNSASSESNQTVIVL